jgi:NADH pyrophosphatase NudC (nudix superfamily)
LHTTRLQRSVALQAKIDDTGEFGFVAEAITRELKCGSELEDVRWFTVSEAKELLVKLSTRFPHLNTIAKRLIRHWLDG